jgi:multimeric flavodoxin WrbA
MKKVIAFIGSPRKKGNTVTIIEEIMKGAKQAGAEVKIYYLNDMKIKPCQGCFYCRGIETCAIRDEMQPIYEDIRRCDAIIIGSPIYMYQVTAQTKLFFDRLFPLIDVNFKPRFGEKKSVMVYSQGHPDPDAFKESIAINEKMLRLGGLNIAETIIVSGANDPTIARDNTKLMEKAFNAGQLLVL